MEAGGGGSADPSTVGSSSSTSHSGPSSASIESSSTGPTLPTQDLVDGAVSDDEEEEPDKTPSWGRLFPLGAGFELIELREKDEYMFGRGSENDVTYEAKNFKKNKSYQSISSKHFKIHKESSSDGKSSNIFLTDLSSNGTFINGEKIGKKNTQVLRNEDEIFFPLRKSKAYVFQDCANGGQESFPEEITKRYVVSRIIGRGAYGEVRLGFVKGSACEKVAIKVIMKKKLSVEPKKAGPKDVNDEAKIQRDLDHPCIIAVKDVIDTEEALFIVLELVEGGELFDRVVSSKRLPEPTAKLLFYQMLLAVQYLHKKGITHRDLKPENVLLSSKDAKTLIKITDFGMSKLVREQSVMKTYCGTESYVAPEVLITNGLGGSYSNIVDCWSLGVILFVCLGGYAPFTVEGKSQPLREQVLQGMYDFPKELWKTVSGEAIDLIKKLLTVDPDKRLTVSEALEHPWMKDEEMIKAAHSLMYPASKDMLPPDVPGKRRFPVDESPEPNNKRSAIAPT